MSGLSVGGQLRPKIIFICVLAGIWGWGLPGIFIHESAAVESVTSQVQGSAKDQPVSQTEPKPPSKEPDLGEIIPLANQLAGDLAALENKIIGLPKLLVVEGRYKAISLDLKEIADRLETLKAAKAHSFGKILEIQEDILKVDKSFTDTGKPLRQAIHQLGAWKKDWLAQRQKWDRWQGAFLDGGEIYSLQPIFQKAKETTDTALHLLDQHLGLMLAAQEKVGEIQTQIHTLESVADRLWAEKRQAAFVETSPPMFSIKYLSQFKSDLWISLKEGWNGVSWSGSRFLAQQKWTLLLELFLFLIIALSIYRNRLKLRETKRWNFIARRPFSAGLFLVSLTTMLVYGLLGVSSVWRLINLFFLGISFARLLGTRYGSSWKGQLVYGLIILVLVTRSLSVIGFPLPLYRLYLVFVTVAGILSCFGWAKESRRLGDRKIYRGALYSAFIFLSVVLVMELWGKHSLALYLFSSLINSLGATLAFMFLMYLIRGALEWLFHTWPFQHAAEYEIATLFRHVTLFFDIAVISIILIPAILVIWGGFETQDATKSFLSLGFTLGAYHFNVGLILGAFGVFYGSYLLSELFQKIIMDQALARRHVEKGVRLAMGRLVHYFVLLIGFLVAVSLLGFEVTKITILLGALGVGIGFGLQGIVNNFVSGIILLVERPVRVGDTIEIDGKWAEIKRIGLRSTTVQTLEQADVIIPNADLINNQVTNWTLSNRQVRLTIPVGVAYGSDVRLAMETLLACAKENSDVSQTPEPQVLFLSFGESSLEFELRAWVRDVSHRLAVNSELHQEIDRRFRKAKIEIAFPQRDLHLRSVDKSAVLPALKIEKNLT